MFLFSQERMRCELLFTQPYSKRTGVMGLGPKSSALWSKDLCNGVLVAAHLKIIVMCWGRCWHNSRTPSKVYHITITLGLPQQAGSHLCYRIYTWGWRVLIVPDFCLNAVQMPAFWLCWTCVCMTWWCVCFKSNTLHLLLHLWESRWAHCLCVAHLICMYAVAVC